MTVEQNAPTPAVEAPVPSNAAETMFPQESNTPAPSNQPAPSEMKDGAVKDEDKALAKPEQKPEEKKAPAVPEKYEFTFPEGVTADADTMTAFEALAREHGLSQEAAQKFIALGAQNAQKQATQSVEQLKATRAKWVEDVKKDAEIGGDNLPANLAVAKRALDAAKVPELGQLLVQSGLGDHPAVVKAFYRLGALLSEDKIVPANGSSGERSAAEVLFGRTSNN